MLTKKQKKVFQGITPRDAFNYFSGGDPETSGYVCHPVIYPGNGKFYVTGSLKGQPIEIECNTLDEAVEAWKKTYRSHDYAIGLLKPRDIIVNHLKNVATR